MPSLPNDIRQLFARSVLIDFDRLRDAEVGFTFNAGDVYLSSFAEAMELLEVEGFRESDPDLLSFAQVFERFVTHGMDIVDPLNAALISACLYWLSGYTANALVISRLIAGDGSRTSSLSGMIRALLSRQVVRGPKDEQVAALYDALQRFMAAGGDADFKSALESTLSLSERLLNEGDPEDYVLSVLLTKVLDRLGVIGFWPSIRDVASAPMEEWRRYIESQSEMGTPIYDLWPSQRAAIRKGLLDGASSIAVRMPTSSGKTKMTELAFLNDLGTYADRKCLYLAPYRALVGEVEANIGGTLSHLGFPVASLYGGAEANELEVRLAEIARVVIATPEKIDAVLRLSEGSLADFGTIVLDEGHLVDSVSRGASYELQLARLRSSLGERSRAIFISAVLPNASEIASWLLGSPDRLAVDTWQPTTMRIGVVTWPEGRPARLTYFFQTGQPVTDGFFVPRLLEEESWQEFYPETGQLRTHRFPVRKDNGSIAAALAFQASRKGPVIVFSYRPDWADSIGRKIIERSRLSRPLETGLVDDNNADVLGQLSDFFRGSLGEGSILPDLIALGIGVHHGGIPQALRLVLENEFRRGNIRMLIATNTIAQGVNFPAKTVIVHSFPHTDAPVRDFWNLAGRAGRALRETEGEVLILGTGNLKPSTLSRFLDRDAVEPAESMILKLVEEILKAYPTVTDETLAALLAEHPDGARLADTVRSIDTALIEVMAEDVDADSIDPNFQSLVANLFATYQAAVVDAQAGTSLEEGVRDLLMARRSGILERIPRAANRRRFSKSAVSTETAITFDDSLEDIEQLIALHDHLDREAFAEVLEIAVRAPELDGLNPRIARDAGYIWMETGRYGDVFEALRDDFKDLNEAVTYIERELAYRLAWILSGLVRIFEYRLDEQGEIVKVDPPDWLALLPDFLRYGANRVELTWVMSLGIHDRRIAEWITFQFVEDRGRLPRSFMELTDWIIASNPVLLEGVHGVWPSYFIGLLRNIVDRYRHINELLKRVN